ncbi:NAD(P)H-binding protein [Amycolatopsis mediterranei]|uniref:NAD(P)H-binding protein n=1 Tax=Amycolatopsis mediterranei TaxID=33910 RepID=UPI000300D083|nr:NAD(P)H-binding protein [Amycolatopsis mediterranei]UZF73906.1 NAD(P)H-binding protein [Amycolatopsis mediterranei]
MTIAIIGATGKLGGLILDALLHRGVPAGDILALGRNAESLAALAQRGLRTSVIDLDDVAGTAAALTGVEKLLLVSFGDLGGRVAQHGNAIDAARQANVPHLVYTSGLHAPTTVLRLAADHKATEELITASGIPATFLRNGWYTETTSRTSPPPANTASSPTASAMDASPPPRARTTPKPPPPSSPLLGTKARPTNCPATSPGTSPNSPPPHKNCAAGPWSTSRSPPNRNGNSCCPTAWTKAPRASWSRSTPTWATAP